MAAPARKVRPGEVAQSTLDNGLAGVLNVSEQQQQRGPPLNQPADTSYNQTQMQDALAKLDESILALRR